MNTNATRYAFTVTTGQWFDEPAGIVGFTLDGWTGQTPEEAVMLALIESGMSHSEAFDIVCGGHCVITIAN